MTAPVQTLTSRRELTRLEAGALRAALADLLDQSRHFSICTFDQMVKVYGAIPDRRDYQALRLLHCINWSKMDSVTRQEAHAAILRTFNAEPSHITAFVDAFEDPTPAKVSLFRRLTRGAV